jgi:phosphohistidine swiveling domain-containing protein
MTDEQGIARLQGVRLRTTSIFFRGEETFFYAKSAEEFDSRASDEAETQQRMLAALEANPRYPQDSLKRFQESAKPFLEFCGSFDSAESFSTKEIVAAHARYSREYRELSFDGEPVAFMLQQPLASKIEAIVKTKLVKTKISALNDAVALLSTPDEASFVKREEFDLLAAASRVAEGKASADGEAEAHWREYAWLEYDYEGSLLSKKHFKRLIQESIKAANGNPRARLESLKKADASSRKRRVELEETLGLTEKERAWSASLRACSQVMDLKKEVFSRSHVQLAKLLAAAGKKIGLTAKQLLYFTASEFPRAIKDAGWARSAFAERRACSLWVSRGGATTVYAGASSSPILDKFTEYAGWASIEATQSKKASGVVTGLPASPGKARGPARVVLRADDIARVRKGDVLVSIMTTVGFVPAMKRAAAIVTDEGGVTCHAAIVARELGVPCVVATRNASIAFKDGDLIEVDANKGVVKKIS